MPQEYFGRFNYRNAGDAPRFDPPHLAESMGGVVTVDGRPIQYAWYADTAEGVAKGYVLGDDGKVRLWPGNWNSGDFPGREIEAYEVAENGSVLLSETFRGHVRIFGK